MAWLGTTTSDVGSTQGLRLGSMSNVCKEYSTHFSDDPCVPIADARDVLTRNQETGSRTRQYGHSWRVKTKQNK